jgi:hypothetical protein
MTDEELYLNALRWIRTVAGMHYLGGAFDPEHMRAIANMAADAIAGKPLPDHTKSMEESRKNGREMADRLGKGLTGDEEK